ncbi:MAG TPA: hypothetical protein PKO30_03105 [Prolixibacteraceae bacterium]|nr:hypothetical protein [Prolixibacteraceae bacterium]
MSEKPKTLADLGFADITPETETKKRHPFENVRGELNEIARAFYAGEISSEEARRRVQQVREKQENSGKTAD